MKDVVQDPCHVTHGRNSLNDDVQKPCHVTHGSNSLNDLVQDSHHVIHGSNSLNDVVHVDRTDNLSMSLRTVFGLAQLERSVKISMSRPTCIFRSGDDTFVVNDSCRGTIDIIHRNSTVEHSFIQLADFAWGTRMHKDRIYCLMRGDPSIMYVFDLGGKIVAEWKHESTRSWYYNFVIVLDQVIIPDRHQKQLKFYSLEGKLVSNVPCPQLSNHWIVICIADPSSIVISDYASSQVFKYDITTNQTIWTCRDITYPLGVACYKEQCILVASLHSNALKVLSVETG